MFSSVGLFGPHLSAIAKAHKKVEYIRCKKVVLQYICVCIMSVDFTGDSR